MMMMAPMTIIMLNSMRSMLPSPRLNIIIGGDTAIVFIVGFIAMRPHPASDCRVTALDEPNHSGAILMCEKASITVSAPPAPYGLGVEDFRKRHGMRSSTPLCGWPLMMASRVSAI